MSDFAYCDKWMNLHTEKWISVDPIRKFNQVAKNITEKKNCFKKIDRISFTLWYDKMGGTKMS